MLDSKPAYVTAITPRNCLTPIHYPLCEHGLFLMSIAYWVKYSGKAWAVPQANIYHVVGLLQCPT